MMDHLKTRTTCIDKADPDPIVIINLCVSGVSMAAAFAAVLMGYKGLRIQRRAAQITENSNRAELVSEMQHLTVLVRHLNNTIRSFRRNAHIAHSFVINSRESNQKQTKFSFGTSFVELSDTSLEMWNLLVDQIANDIKLMNRYVIEATRSLSTVFRLLASHLNDERIYYHIKENMHEAHDRSAHFRKLLFQYQSMTAKTPLTRALQLLGDLSVTAEAMTDPLVEVLNLYSHEI